MEIILITTFILSFVFIHFLIKYSKVLGLQDIPNARSAHTRIVPRSAGLGFVSAALISLCVFEFDHVVKNYYVYISILAVMLLGLVDDKFNISHRVKFLGLLLIAGVVAFNGVTINSLGNYFGYEVTLVLWLAIPFTIFAVVGFTNALNLMDGLDGLAGGLTTIILFAFLMIGYTHNDQFIVFVSATFIVTILAFLIFNWHPAKIFMGDSGSLTLGFVISILSVKSLAYMTPSAVLFIMALPLIDTFIVMRRRIQRGQSPFKADKNHIHHFMYRTKVNVKVSVKLLLYMQLALSIIGYQLRAENEILSLALFGLLLYVFLNLFDQRFRYREPKKKKSKRLKFVIKVLRRNQI
jgi:UDP-GlcNAc:undecaprenyl-phosphate/decaprenyl-phosphate GlcNAc-1-phosphate transferase